MLSYIASESTANIINDVCKELNVTVLTSIDKVNLLKYIKQTKVNFNLIKYFIIDLSSLINQKDEIINTIVYFKELYINTRIIIIAKRYEDQDEILTSLYEKGIYNIINVEDDTLIKNQLQKSLTDSGIQKKEVKRFEKVKDVVQKESKIKKLVNKGKNKTNKRIKDKKEKPISDMPTNSVYLFSLLLEAVTRFVKFICYISIFILTSIGLTILLNTELREIVFQILGLK